MCMLPSENQMLVKYKVFSKIPIKICLYLDLLAQTSLVSVYGLCLSPSLACDELSN